MDNDGMGTVLCCGELKGMASKQLETKDKLLDQSLYPEMESPTSLRMEKRILESERFPAS
jgi:hypothetical protein